MAKPPRELTKQIENIEAVIAGLSDLINDNKIKIQYYGKDFLSTLSEIQQEALALRNKLEEFKNELEETLTSQYGVDNNRRFAGAADKVIEGYLSSVHKED